jgi:vacuolar-type H+-ATPase subunit H
MVNSKHIATFILGAAAGLALSKYLSMSDEEKEKLMGDLKAKANSFKDEAENAADKAKTYFEELRTKGAESLKEHMAEAEKMVNDLFNKKPENA